MIEHIQDIIEIEVGNNGLTEDEYLSNSLTIDVLERPMLSIAYILEKGY